MNLLIENDICVKRREVVILSRHEGVNSTDSAIPKYFTNLQDRDYSNQVMWQVQKS